MMDRFLAIDLGATSGRHIVGYFKNGNFILNEVYRFKTGVQKSKDGLIWNLDSLFNHIVKGIKCALAEYKNIVSLSIDTWGVDYVLLDKDGKAMHPYYAYRNDRTEKRVDEVHNIISFDLLYSKTGIQFANFNTIYQLYDDLKNKRLEEAKVFLMLPEYFNYLLTGVIKKEYTNATTTGLINVLTKKYDDEILTKLGYPKHLFKELYMPGTLVGQLMPEIQTRVKGNVDVILAPTHDTASAFEAVDCDDNSIIISSGTWSLLGVKIKNANTSLSSKSSNFTNEGGVGYIRYLKNIMGMWVVNQICRENDMNIRYELSTIKESNYKYIFNVNDESLLSPSNMTLAVKKLLSSNPTNNIRDLLNATLHSLAYSYKVAVAELENNLGRTYSTIYIIGGGANNYYLNSLVEIYTGKKVVALPMEATALGNIKTQHERIKKYEKRS